MLASMISALVVGIVTVTFAANAITFGIDMAKKAGNAAQHYYEEAVDYIDGE